MRCQSQGFDRILGWNTGHFKKYPAGFHYRHPMVNAGFPTTHSSFGGLFGYRLIRENPGPTLVRLF